MTDAPVRKVISIWLVGAIFLCLLVPRLWAAESDTTVPLGESTITLGTAPYADELTITHLAKQMLQELGYQVQVKQADVGIWFAGVASGDIDVGLNAWLPVTHGQYYKKYRDKLLDLGVIYKPTKLGWVVPDYVPSKTLDSIPDLKKPEVKKKLNGVITGISAGAGEMRLSGEAMKKYRLSEYGYTLQTSSGPAMTAALSRAIQHHQWIVVTGWTPHWMWARWKLRYLKDPKGLLGKEGTVHAVATLDFRDRFPRATAFIEHFKLPVSDVEDVMNDAAKLSGGEPYATAAKKYIKSHPDVVKQWLQSTGVTK